MTWSGRSRQRWVSRSEYFLIVFCLIAVTIGSLFIFIRAVSPSGQAPPVLAGPLVLGLGIAAFCYGMSVARWRRTHSTYVITNSRAIVVRHYPRRARVRAVPLASSFLLVEKMHHKDTYTIRFGDPRVASSRPRFFDAMYPQEYRWYSWEEENDSPIPKGQSPGSKPIPHIAFHDVEHPGELFEAINTVHPWVPTNDAAVAATPWSIEERVVAFPRDGQLL